MLQYVAPAERQKMKLAYDKDLENVVLIKEVNFIINRWKFAGDTLIVSGIIKGKILVKNYYGVIEDRELDGERGFVFKKITDRWLITKEF